MGGRLAALLHDRPAAILAAALALGVLATASLVDLRRLEPRIPIDPSIDRISEPGSAAAAEKELYAALRFDALFTPTALEQLRDFIDLLKATEGIARVDSLANATHVDQSSGITDLRGALDVVPGSVEEARVLGEGIQSSSLYSPFVSRDARSTLIFVIPARDAVLDIDAIRRGAAETAPDATLLLTGSYFADREALPILIADLQRTIPVALLALSAVAWFALRSFRGVVLAVSADALATLFTVAFFVAIGWKLNIVTVITPVVVLVVGFAYAIHVLTEFDHQLYQGEGDLRGVVRRALDDVAPPLALTALTTCAGFLSLLLSRIVAIREFGVICAVGVLVALATALLVLPAALSLWPPKKLHESGGGFSRFNDRWAARFAAIALRRRRMLMQAGVLATVVAGVGVLQIESSTDFVSNFKPDAPVRRDFEQLNRDFEAAVPVEIAVNATHDIAFLEPKNLERLSALQRALAEMPEVGHTTSLSDYVSFVYLSYGGKGDPGALPRNRNAVDQLLSIAPREATRRFVDARYRDTTIRVQMQQMSSSELLEWVERIERELNEILAEAGAEELEATVVGNTVRVAATVEELTRGQVASISLALFVIFAVLSLLFQSARVGLLAMIPNVIPIIVYFGTLGLLGIPLSVTTALVACSVLGIAVDDSIHFLTRFNESARARANEAAGVQDALRLTLRPITVTTAALVAGLLALATSDLRNIVEFGALAAFTLAVTWLLDVTFTPALCLRLRFVTLWDSLTHDLGAEPNETIPLFEYMSPRQARIAALLGSERHIRAGDRLLSRGDPGGTLFVIVEGEMEVSYADGRPVARLGRGALLGEASVFGKRRRNANVDALTDVRVLRWSNESIDRIQRRHPRVATLLLRRLSEIMADRWSETTSLLQQRPSRE